LDLATRRKTGQRESRKGTILDITQERSGGGGGDTKGPKSALAEAVGKKS